LDRIDIRDIRREQLVKATIGSIALRGFAKTTLSQVASHAHLSHGIVNFYFKSKDDLLIATLQHMFNEYDAYSVAAVERAGQSPVSRLTALVDVDFDPAVVNREKVTVWYAFWGETRWRKDFLKLCSSWSNNYFERVRGVVQNVIDFGGYSRLDAGVIARGLVAMLDGLWLDVLINGDTSVPAARLSIQSYLAGIFPNEFGQKQRRSSVKTGKKK